MAREQKLVWGRVSRRLLLAAVFSLLVLVFAPLFFWAVEHDKSADVHSIGDAYGWLFRTLFENTSPYKLKTQFGFLSYWIVRVAGVSLVAFATATIASRFVATVINRGAGMGKFKGSNHLLICGWSPKGFEIIRELRANEVEDPRPIVILADIETDPVDQRGVTFVRGNPSDGQDLSRAGLERVSTVIVLADGSNPSMNPDDLDARCTELLKLVALEEKAAQLPRDLTQVEMRKLELARAMAAEPKLLIADESMAGLSNSEVTDIVALLIQLNERGITIIMIEHIMRAVMSFSQRLVVLVSGKKIADGSPDVVIRDPEVEKAYLGQ